MRFPRYFHVILCARKQFKCHSFLKFMNGFWSSVVTTMNVDSTEIFGDEQKKGERCKKIHKTFGILVLNYDAEAQKIVPVPALEVKNNKKWRRKEFKNYYERHFYKISFKFTFKNAILNACICISFHEIVQTTRKKFAKNSSLNLFVFKCNKRSGKIILRMTRWWKHIKKCWMMKKCDLKLNFIQFHAFPL